ncbi:hypothetical protein HUU05_26145 [candidate division KSB1 bacterium]|nr:hypothetical protein [candidate division KSB1 bacterium]
MIDTTPSTNISVNPFDLESLIRRVVREEVMHLLRKPNRAVVEYWEHEGPDDPAGDQQLLNDALALLQKYETNREGWKTLEEFEAELAEAEVKDELPC